VKLKSFCGKVKPFFSGSLDLPAAHFASIYPINQSRQTSFTGWHIEKFIATRAA